MFLICCIGFIVGVAIASFLPISWTANDVRWFAGAVACLVLVILFYQHINIRLVGLIGLFLFLGVWRYAICLPKNTPDKIWHYNGQSVDVKGYVCNEPDERARGQKLEICAQSIKARDISFQPRVEQGVTGKILLTTNLYPSFNYFDYLEISCDLEAPEEFNGFSYDRYLARYDIFSVCYYPKIINISDYKPDLLSIQEKFYLKIFGLKNKLRNLMDQGLGQEESGLANAIVLGYKRGIPDSLRDSFSKAGLSHIIAISGMHIGILAVLIMGFLAAIGLKRKKAFWLASSFLLFYILLVGLPASAMRAGLMSFLVLWAMNLGRLNKLTNSLALAAMILLIINPRLLRDDIGFQLSFLAVAGIAYFYPLLENWQENKFKNTAKFIKTAFVLINITLAAQVFTLPLIAYNYSLISVISPLSNLLVLWCLPLLMAAIIGGLLFSLFLPNFSLVFFFPARILLKYIIVTAEEIIKIPYAYIEVDYLWSVWLVIYYAIVTLAILKITKAQKHKRSSDNF